MYDAATFPAFAVTVDLVVLTIREGALCVLLVERGEAPFAGDWALPGGFVRPAEDLAAAARRELAEETGLAGVHVEQLASYGDPGRDPRMRVVSIAHLALAPDLPTPRAGTDASGSAWRPVDGTRGLAFDHDRILADGVERARSKIEYTALATAFCAPEFTVADLRKVYEAVWGTPIDPRNFHRKVTGSPGLITATGTARREDVGRPAALFRAGDPHAQLVPPLMRSTS